MKRIHMQFTACLLASMLLLGLGACTDSAPTKESKEDVLTQKAVSPDKIPVTVLVKNAFTINAFEEAAEKQFPQLELIQVGNHTRDMGIAEYEARLKNDDLTDLVMTWPLDVGNEYWEDRFIDLSSLSLSGKYVTSMLDNISHDGKLYYLPGPSQVRAIVYNKTLFREKGWKVPKDFDTFVQLCQTIEQSGIRSLQLGLGNSEVLDTAFVGYGYKSCFSKPENAKKIADYNEGKGSFGDNFGVGLDTFQTLIDAGVLQKGDLKLTYADREHMLFNRQCAMVEDSVLVARMGMEFNGCTDEFGLMPFFNPGTDSDWARLYPVCYIGVNKHLQEKKNDEKYEMVMELMEYISTPEGQIALAGDTGAMFSSLKGVGAPDIPEITDLIPTLAEGRYAVFPTLKNAQGALRSGLAGMVEGTLTAADVIKLVDKENQNPPVKASVLSIGQASKDFSLTQTGNFLTDAMREKTGCQLALFLDNGKDGRTNGKGVSGKFYQGDLTSIDVGRVLPDLRYGETGELCKISMTGEDLIKTLEYSIPVGNDQEGWFYYFSGLKMEFAPAADPGKRIRKISDAEGKPIDPKKVYSVAIMDDSVPEKFVKSCQPMGLTMQELVEDTIISEKTISPSDDGRLILCEP